MFGIPTLVVDYENDPKIFDPNNKDQFRFNYNASTEKNLYNLRKCMLKAYRNAGLPLNTVNEVVDRNAAKIIANFEKNED